MSKEVCLFILLFDSSYSLFEARFGKNVIRFDGTQYLTLGAPSILDFQPNSNFYILVACDGLNNILSKSDMNSRSYHMNLGPALTIFAFGGSATGATPVMPNI